MARSHSSRAAVAAAPPPPAPPPPTPPPPAAPPLAIDRFEVARALREIALLLELSGGNPFKARAYESGARALEGADQDVERLVTEGRLTALPGIGPALAGVIEELVRTGHSPLLSRLRESLPPGVVELSPVLGVRRLRVLHQALGIASLADLEAACAAGRVRAVKGFGEKTERKLLESVRALAAGGQQLLLHQATALAGDVLQYLRSHPVVEQAEIAGALRRRCEVVDSLEFVVAAGNPGAVLEHARRFPQVAAAVRLSARRGEYRLAEGLPLVVTAVGPRSFAATLHRLTGSATHLAKLDQLAHARAELFAGEAAPAPTRKSAAQRRSASADAPLYRRLGLPFIPPELREDWGEIEAALDGTLPAPLLELADLRGALHCHTNYSDGRASIEQMARGAQALGFSYLTITDHSPSATYAGGLSLERLREQWDEIARVQETVEIRLLRGIEADILADGALDLPDRVLAQLDVVIASIHSRHRLDRVQMTRRIATAMRHRRFKIWGHALGRYVLSRPPIDCDVEAILDVIAESRAAIEVNGDPHRLDLAPRWIQRARQRGIRFTIGADAHSVAGIKNLRWGVDMARRGGLTARDVLNTLEAEAFRRGETVTSRFPRLPITPPYPPMEAHPVDRLPAGEGWQFEPKWDGFRCLAFRDGDEIELQSKAGQPLARYFPEVVEQLRALPSRFVIDGELVVPVDGKLSFDDLLQRIHPAPSRIARLARERPAVFIVFDLLVDDAGRSLLERPLRERRRRLESFAAKFPGGEDQFRLSPATTELGRAEDWLASAGADLDGVVAKRLELAYQSGTRSGMQKVKRLRTADCVVGGFRYAAAGDREAVGSLLLGLYDDEGLLHHVGFTSSFKAAERPALLAKLLPLVKPPGFTGRAPGGPSRWSTERSGEWVPLQPKLVVEVRYDHFTGGRFRHGTKLLRWRPDKAPRQCRLEQVSAEAGG